jgi:hypothetical protein
MGDSFVYEAPIVSNIISHKFIFCDFFKRNKGASIRCDEVFDKK